MFYHAKVTLKHNSAKDKEGIAFEPDLSRRDIVTAIALPYLRGQDFSCGGRMIEPFEVQTVRFYRSMRRASDEWDMVRGTTTGGTIFSRLSDMSARSEDVTLGILKEAQFEMLALPTAAKEDRQPIASKSKRIFVVHGHDLKSVEQTEMLLRRLDLEPIILKDAPSGGRTVIEKFEVHSDVGAAIVLLTPDDLGGGVNGELSPRARQNVIWEWGYLVSRLGRANVICLYKGGVEIPSDLDGLVTIHISDEVREKADEIRRELSEAGYNFR